MTPAGQPRSAPLSGNTPKALTCSAWLRPPPRCRSPKGGDWRYDTEERQCPLQLGSATDTGACVEISRLLRPGRPMSASTDARRPDARKPVTEWAASARWRRPGWPAAAETPSFGRGARAGSPTPASITAAGRSPPTTWSPPACTSRPSGPTARHPAPPSAAPVGSAEPAPVELARAEARIAGLEEVVARQDDELRFLRLTIETLAKRGAA